METYTLKDVKQHLKEMGKVISTLKRLRKETPDLTGIKPEMVEKAEAMASQNGGVINAIENAKWNYRHHHIVASEFRGKTREQIEQPTEGNEPNEVFIADIKNKIYDAMEVLRAEREEAICISA